MINQITGWLDKTIARGLILLMALMVVTVVWQVFTRYLLNSPSSYTEELATYLLIWVSLLGTVYALRLKAHLGIDFMTRNLQGTAQKVSHHFVCLAVILFSVLIFVYGGTRLVYITLKLNQLSAAFKVPVGYVYTIIPISGLLLVFYSVLGIFQYGKTLDNELDKPTIVSE
jgi:TRAP-type C4-dicarboxylate transport system permease small subunit